MLINWIKYIYDLLPISLRKVRLFNMIYVLTDGFRYVYEQYLIYKKDIEYKLAHTSQVGSLENVLNDAFDIDQRRIYIEDVGGWDVIIVNLDADQLPLLVIDLDEDGADHLIQPDSFYEGSVWDFIIVLPFAIVAPEIYRLHALVTQYKLPGMRYDIIVV